MALFDTDMPLASPYAVELQALEDYRWFSATTIQRFYRGWICRIRLKRQKTARQQREQAEACAAKSGQQLYRAARCIQDAWRTFNNRRIYRYYRDLIRFREVGDPRQMLRCIHAREAALIDAAAGVHVRFRLGGSSFPPLIFYKIFTHRPVTDIGAFGPRNYAAEAAALTAVNTTAMLHNKPPEAGTVGSSSGSYVQQTSSSSTGRQKRWQQQQQEFELPARLREYVRPDGSLGYRSTRGWYLRQDRNGWRPVADRLLLEPEQQAALPASSSSSPGSGHRQRTRRRVRCRQQLHGSLSGADCSGCDGDVSLPAEQQQQPHREDGGSGDEVSCGSSGRSSSNEFYHHSPVVRRQDRARQLKQRQRHWLLKMYRAGMQASAPAPRAESGGDSGSSCAGGTGHALAGQPVMFDGGASRRRSSAAGDSAAEEQLLQQLERKLLCSDGASSDCASAAAGDDSQMEELLALGLDAGLLAWSQRLDFDSYQRDWAAMAVMLGSEALLPEREPALVAQLQEAEVAP